MKIKLLFILLFIHQFAFAQKEIPLYEGKPKGSEDWKWSESVSEKNIWNTKLLYNVVHPTITAYLPPYYLATGTAVIIAPGGGYHALSIDSEGHVLAKWLQSKGVAAFVLKYRLVHSLTDEPAKEVTYKKTTIEDAKKVAPLALADGLKAVEYVREHAKELDIHPDKIGFMGFSAGGHLTMNVAYNGKERSLPNFIAPIYAWDLTKISEKAPKDTMPIFVTVATDDELNLLPYSLEIYQQWVNAGYPAELHAYQTGGHGFGMRIKHLPTDNWYKRFGEWLHLQGYLKKLYPNKYEKLYGEDAVARGKIETMKQLQTNYAQLNRYKAANEKLPTPKPDENRVVFLGNSITDSWAVVDSTFFAGNDFIGRGISGQTSSQLLLRFRQDVINLKPKAVVIHIGVNDVAENTGPFDPDFTINNIQSMVELAKINGIKVILTTVLPTTKFEWNRKLGDPSAKIIDLNNRIKRLAEKENISCVDYYSGLKNDKNVMDKDIASDGVHPTLKGYEMMKAMILPAIQEILKH